MKNWKHSFYRQTGLLHSTCQDCVDVYEDDRCIVSCLCDGLGSLNHSEIAAQTTVKSVIELLKKIEPAIQPSVAGEKLEQFKKKLVAELQDRLNRAATENGISLNSMDCTLLFLLISKEQNYALIGNLGDSALCVIRSEDSKLYCDSAFIGTRAVLDEDAAEHLHCDLIPLDDSILGFVLTSDGLENEIYFKGLSFVGKNTELYVNALLADNPKAKLEQLVKTLTTEPDTIFDDDVSVAVISCTDESVVLEDEPTWPCVCGADNPMCETFCTACSRDFLDLYADIDFNGDKTAFFRKLQHDPDEKEKLKLLLQDADRTAAINPFAEQTQTAPLYSPEVITAPIEPQQRQPASFTPPAPSAFLPNQPQQRQHPQQRQQPRPAAPQPPAQKQPMRPAPQRQAAPQLNAAPRQPMNQGARPAQQQYNSPAPQQAARKPNQNNNTMLYVLIIGLVIGVAVGGLLMLILFRSCKSEEPEPTAPEITTTVTVAAPTEPPTEPPATAVTEEAPTEQPTQGTSVVDQQDENNDDNDETDDNDNDNSAYPGYDPQYNPPLQSPMNPM